MKNPTWLKPAGIVVAIIVAAVLLAGIIAVPYRSTRPPHGYDQARLHWNTKNSTRFDGAGIEAVAALVSRAVYPATSDETRPDVVLLYEDWRDGLLAAPLLRPLNAVLLPISEDAANEIERLAPAGSDVLDGVGVITLGEVEAPEGGFEIGTLSAEEVIDLRSEIGRTPAHAILVDPDDPETALLAAPWAAYSGDLILFDSADAPEGVPLYALGAAEAEGAKSIGGQTSAHVAVNFAQYEDAEYDLFGWGFNADSLTGYRAYTIARPDLPEMALLSANLARRGKPGPLLWTDYEALPVVVNDYLWTQRAAFWVTPSEGPFHHFWILGDTEIISFPAQGQADYAVEIGPYIGKGAGMSGIEAAAAGWVALGIASTTFVAFHAAKFLPFQGWLMRLAWPLFALMAGPFGIPLYYLAHNRPVIRSSDQVLWDRPLWLQGIVATVSAVGFGASIMIATGFVITFLGMPLFPAQGPLFFVGTPMIITMIINYIVAVLVSWPLFQAPMIAMFYGISYRDALPKALPMVLISMSAAALGMNPWMWGLMMWHIPMSPTEESILWFGTMFFTAFTAFLIALPFNYLLVRNQRKSGMM